MKKLFFIALVSLVLFSCKKDDEPVLPGHVSLKVSYYYNAYQGYKPDVGAVAYLHESKYGSMAYLDSIGPIAARVGLLIDKEGDLLRDDANGVTYKYEGEADVSGLIDIIDIAPGSYYLVVASKGRYTFSTKTITVKSGETQSLIKNFNYLNDFDYGGESW